LFADSPPLLSCIVPFKSFAVLEANLLPCLSALNQECEVVFVHDSESPILESELNRLNSIPPKIKYLFGIFGNAGLARNEGLDKADGEWIVFWDSDDRASPGEALRIIDNARKARTIVTRFSVKNTLSNSKLPSTPITKSRIVANPGIWRFIFPSVFVKSIRFPNILIGEDLCFLISAQVFDQPIQTIEIETYEYRLSKYQTTYNLEGLEPIKLLIEQLLRELIRTKPRNYVAFGIFFRQLNSLALKSKGKEMRFIVSRFFSLLTKVKPFQFSSFFIGICVSFRRGIF
jgi:glycosyltransferase involved in cell wall biosynthesis